MITLIIGQNGIGKSVYLRNKVKSSANTNGILCNFLDKAYLRNKEYNKERIYELKELLDTDNIIENKGRLEIETDVISISSEFEDILTVICKDGNELYMDDPELGLSYKQIGRLITFIARVEDTFKSIEIATHSEMFLGLTNTSIKTVKYDSSSNTFAAIDIMGSAYEIID